MELKTWLESIGVGVMKNVCGHSGLRKLKLTASLKQKELIEKTEFAVLIKIHVEDYGHCKTERVFMILKQTFRG